MNRAFVEIPHVERLGANRWSIKWAGCGAFEVDDNTFTTIVRALPRTAQHLLFERLSDALSRRPGRDTNQQLPRRPAAGISRIGGQRGQTHPD
jgi:hypothetical protein